MRRRLEEELAKRLFGTSGDLGQRDFFDIGDLFSRQPETGYGVWQPSEKPVTEAISLPVIRVRVPEGATMIRVTDAKGRKAVVAVDEINRHKKPFTKATEQLNPFAGVRDVVTVEAGIKSKGKFQPVPGDIIVEVPAAVLQQPEPDYFANQPTYKPREFTPLTRAKLPRFAYLWRRMRSEERKKFGRVKESAIWLLREDAIANHWRYGWLVDPTRSPKDPFRFTVVFETPEDQIAFHTRQWIAERFPKAEFPLDPKRAPAEVVLARLYWKNKMASPKTGRTVQAASGSPAEESTQSVEPYDFGETKPTQLAPEVKPNPDQIKAGNDYAWSLINNGLDPETELHNHEKQAAWWAQELARRRKEGTRREIREAVDSLAYHRSHAHLLRWYFAGKGVAQPEPGYSPQLPPRFWMRPDGEVHRVPFGAHDLTAREILGYKTEDPLDTTASEKLADQGWLRVTMLDGEIAIEGNSPNERQLQILRDEAAARGWKVIDALVWPERVLSEKDDRQQGKTMLNGFVVLPRLPPQRFSTTTSVWISGGWQMAKHQTPTADAAGGGQQFAGVSVVVLGKHTEPGACLHSSLWMRESGATL